MGNTKDSTVVTQAIKDLLEDRKLDLGLTGGTYYGIPGLIDTYPAAAVESYPKSRTLREGTTRQFHIWLRTGIMVYFGQVQSSEITKKQSEEMAEAIENVLHEDFKLGGLVIFGHVTSVDPGVSRLRDVMVRATRIIWEARSREVFHAGI